MLCNAETMVSPPRWAACAALAAERPPARSSCRSNARRRWSMLPISAEIAWEYPDRENMFSPKANSRSGLLSSVHAFEPGVDLALGLVPRHAVALLKPAAELHPGVVLRSVDGNVQPENPARQHKFRCAHPRAVAEKDAGVADLSCRLL